MGTEEVVEDLGGCPVDFWVRNGLPVGGARPNSFAAEGRESHRKPRAHARHPVGGPIGLVLVPHTGSYTMSTVFVATSSALALVCSALMPVFIQLSKTDGKIKYHPMEVSILVEIFKLVVCLCAWSWQKRQDAKDHTSRVRDDGEMIDQFNFRSSLDYAFPAVMFQLGNNMVFFMMMVMDPVTFQLLSNVEILVVALLQRHWMHRILTPKQWLSLVLLVDGVISAELAGGKKVAKVGGGELGPAGIVQAVDSSTGAVTGDTLQHDMFIKYGMVVLIALMRAIGGVGSEYVLKKHSSDSITF